MSGPVTGLSHALLNQWSPDSVEAACDAMRGRVDVSCLYASPQHLIMNTTTAVNIGMSTAMMKA